MHDIDCYRSYPFSCGILVTSWLQKTERFILLVKQFTGLLTLIKLEPIRVLIPEGSTMCRRNNLETLNSKYVDLHNAETYEEILIMHLTDKDARAKMKVQIWLGQ